MSIDFKSGSSTVMTYDQDTNAVVNYSEEKMIWKCREIAARDIIALTFDFSSWGRSEGHHRLYWDPTAKIADINETDANPGNRSAG